MHTKEDFERILIRRIRERKLRTFEGILSLEKLMVKPFVSVPDVEDLQGVSGVYLFIRDSTIVYVGKTTDLHKRLSSHHFGFGAKIVCIRVPLEKLSTVENYFIDKYEPLYNNGDYQVDYELVDLWQVEEYGL